MDKISLGKLGEEIASQYLTSKDYQILHRNFRARTYGEIDLIAVPPHENTLVFVEVKTRVGNQFGSPQEAITNRKIKELRKMVSYYYNCFPETKLSPRIDALAISLTQNGEILKLDHFENITL